MKWYLLFSSLWLAKRSLMLTVCVGVTTGCSALPSRQMFSLDRKSTPTHASSPISQLGVPLPAMQPGDDLQLHLITAEEMAQNGYWDEAVQMYRKAEAMAPKKPKLDAELAPALAGAGQFQEAIQRYRRLVEQNPKDAALRNNFAWTLMESGDLVAAEAEYRQAMTLDPALQNAPLNLGILLAKQSRYAESLAVLTATIGEASAHHNIGVIAIDIGDEATAIRACERASSLPGASNASAEFLASLRPQISQSKFK